MLFNILNIKVDIYYSMLIILLRQHVQFSSLLHKLKSVASQTDESDSCKHLPPCALHPFTVHKVKNQENMYYEYYSLFYCKSNV